MGIGWKKAFNNIKDGIINFFIYVYNETKEFLKYAFGAINNLFKRMRSEAPIITTNFSFLFWAFKKNLFILLRKHMSSIAALFLALATVLRELAEHPRMARSLLVGLSSFSGDSLLEFALISCPKIAASAYNFCRLFLDLWFRAGTSEKIFILAIIVLTLITIGVAIWEFFGVKLDVSQQEKRFAVGIKLLLAEFEKYKFEANRRPPDEVFKVLTEFIKKVLDTAAKTLCGDKKIHAGMISYFGNDEVLKLTVCTDGSGYNETFQVDLKIPVNDRDKGPAQISFEKDAIAHMPNKTRGFGWFYEELGEEDYDWKDFISGWKEPPEKASKLFRSVLSLPVASYAGIDEKNKKPQKRFHGVVSFTARRDFFIPRDFTMASAFASLIAQASDVAYEIKER